MHQYFPSHKLPEDIIVVLSHKNVLPTFSISLCVYIYIILDMYIFLLFF